MADSQFLIHLSGLILITTIVALTIMILLKNEGIKQLHSEVANLKRSLDEMDEQAKLIVRTDVELNRTQEELDKKITGLYALQGLSRAISTTMIESQIFQRIESGYLEDLGFEKVCAFLWDEKEKKFLLHLSVGYAEDEVETIKPFVELNKEIYLELIKNEKTVSSTTSVDAAFKEKINLKFKVIYFVISPVLPKEGNRGFLFVGTANTDMLIAEGDEELITILANQIGQSLENARLFENTWRAQQELERKVEERTRALTQAMEELKIVSKRKNDFISAVSHELRTPLTSVKGYAGILLDERLGTLPPAVKERLAKINIHSDELVHMVNDLLDIARIEAGKTVMKIEEQNLKDIIAKAADLIMLQCKNNNIELLIEVPDHFPRLSADRGQIERVFINLLSNAVKFTPPKGKIIVKATEKDAGVQVDISDTGIGIPPEAIPRLFQEFYRVDTPAHQQLKGTGLGLSLVKHIIEAHKGKIWVESAPGKGSTFSFALPLKSEQ